MRNFLTIIVAFLFGSRTSKMSKTNLDGEKEKVKKIDIETLLETKENIEIVMTIDEYLNEFTNYGEKIEKITKAQRNLIFVENLENEINNGGFNQFYFNTSGDFSLETVDALLAIGANKTANIVKEANSQFPDQQILKDRGVRRETLLQIEDKAQAVWTKCDEHFYKYEENLVDLLVKYIIENKEEFR